MMPLLLLFLIEYFAVLKVTLMSGFLSLVFIHSFAITDSGFQEPKATGNTVCNTTANDTEGIAVWEMHLYTS